MLLRTLQLTARSFRGIVRVANTESCIHIQSQNYGRWAPRQPVEIVNEDELFDVEVNNTTPVAELGKKTRTRSKKLKAKPKTMESTTAIENDDDDDDDHNKEKLPSYKKLHENEKIFSSLMLDVKTKQKRKKNNQILIEGTRLIQDAIAAGIKPETIIFSQDDSIRNLPDLGKNVRFLKIPYRSIQLWSTLTTSPGLMGLFQKPDPLKESDNSLPITIICDNIRDPGNMGSILRAAAGVGCEKVVLTKGCVDFWDPKVLRSGSGAHFRIPVYSSLDWEDIKLLINSDAHVYVADNNTLNEEYDQDDISKEEPMDQENNSISSLKFGKKQKSNLVRQMYDFPLVPYYAVDYTKNQVILIVGGETHGLSTESFKLVESRQGIRVNIPLDNGIDSLNAGMALGIIVFEVKRQFLLAQSKLNQLMQ